MLAPVWLKTGCRSGTWIKSTLSSVGLLNVLELILTDQSLKYRIFLKKRTAILIHSNNPNNDESAIFSDLILLDALTSWGSTRNSESIHAPFFLELAYSPGFQMFPEIGIPLNHPF